MAWYTICPQCETSIIPTPDLSYSCPTCGTSWSIKSQCSNLYFDQYDMPQCVRDSNIGECKQHICPQLHVISYVIQPPQNLEHPDQIPTYKTQEVNTNSHTKTT